MAISLRNSREAQPTQPDPHPALQPTPWAVYLDHHCPLHPECPSSFNFHPIKLEFTVQGLIQLHLSLLQHLPKASPAGATAPVYMPTALYRMRSGTSQFCDVVSLLRAGMRCRDCPVPSAMLAGLPKHWWDGVERWKTKAPWVKF